MALPPAMADAVAEPRASAGVGHDTAPAVAESAAVAAAA